MNNSEEMYPFLTKIKSIQNFKSKNTNLDVGQGIEQSKKVAGRKEEI